MTPAEIQQQLHEAIDKLSSAEQLRLLAAARAMRARSSPIGTPIASISHLTGSLSDADANEMRRAIEEGCEDVNSDEW